ncbi:sorting nexin-25 isoform X2 [Patella vulgata]|uniref:sorting nexin-25 isoform X2 n=1 Tax=Patella vulgata TaxID=6465 RepID=UPI0024A911BE|nr:sorting nexin-25 isoform X2 [Patella vulgata]
MTKPVTVLSAVGGLFIAVGVYYGVLSTMIYIGVHVAIAVVALYFGAQWSLIQGKSYKPPVVPNQVSYTSCLIQKMMEQNGKTGDVSRKLVISRNIDNIIQEVLDLCTQDFILTWYTDISLKQQPLITAVQSEIWLTIGELSRRLSKIDTVTVLTQDIVDILTDHFRDVRLASKRPNMKPGEEVPKFLLHPWLVDEKSELDFLRKVCETLLVTLLPHHYAKNKQIRHLLREIITSSTLKPVIDLLCDPDYINQKLLDYLKYRQKLSEDTRRTYTYAPTYEDFVKMIAAGDDIEHLKQIRYNIMSEIMQSTTINNIKKAKGLKIERESAPKGLSKGELLKARNLKRYINQLTVAKQQCEKRIQSLGGPDYKSYNDPRDELLDQSLPGQTVLSFNVIMDITKARECFMKYLKKDGCESLLGFWNAVEDLRSSNKQQRHQLASELYQQYIASTSTAVKLDKTIIKNMELFLRGDKGPEAFYDGQKQINTLLEEKYYPSFIVSDKYHQYISYLQDRDIIIDESSKDNNDIFDDDDIDETSTNFIDQSYHAKQTLDLLDEKIVNKSQALQAFKTSQKPDEKMKKVEKDMETDLTQLKLERRQLESHIARTEKWVEYQGHWKANVQSAQVEVENQGDRSTPYFVLVVHLSGHDQGEGHGLRDSVQGWVVSRTLEEFQTLHQKLVQIGPWLRKKEIPTTSMNPFRSSVDTAFLDKAKTQLDEYLVAVMKDERMNQSEALYSFLTPTPEYLQQPVIEKKNKFSGFVNLMKSNKDDISRDSIAKPLYRFMNEVFELRGMFKWLRKSFITFVEVTFGRSINRQLHETVDWVFSESMIIYYIQLFKDSMWTDGKLADSAPPRTDEEKMATRVAAKEKFLANVPDALKNLVGEDNAKHGTIKMFEVMQDVRLNKQIFYSLLQVFLWELCPELENIKSPVDPAPQL